MGAFMQMGHDTRNLVGEVDLQGFKGIVLSPVNRDPGELAVDVPTFRERGDFHIILDPQLYVPRSERGSLSEYSYFPDDLDSGDLASENWWNSLAVQLSSYSIQLGVDSVASPAVLPRSWKDDYYSLCLKVATTLSNLLKDKQDVWQTLIVDITTLGTNEDVLRIASIITQTKCVGYYLVVVCSGEPRREIRDHQGLAGAMYLVRLLEDAGRPVLVAYSSSDMLLYKAAGASHCGTGKFFNLRRFTPARFGEETKGGGQLAYWFEHSLLAFLREGDIQLLTSERLSDYLAAESSNNHWGSQILELLSADEGQAWVGLGWRHFLSWFWRTEAALDDQALSTVKTWLKDSEERWLTLEDKEILFDDPRNDGKWLRPWRQAVAAFSRAANIR